MIDKKEIILKINEAIEKGKKRKFSQSLDLSIGFKHLDFKNPANAIEEVVLLPKERGKPVVVCGLVDKDMQTIAKENLDKVIMKDEFPKWLADKKGTKKLADECDFFIAQANLMGEVAKNFGRIFGPRNKMPNPKASCVVPVGSKLDVLKERLKRTIVLKAKKSPVVNIKIGTDKQKPEDLADNISAIMEVIIKRLPNGEQNIKNVHVKTSMGPSIKVM